MAKQDNTPNAAEEMGVNMSDPSDKAGDKGKVGTDSQQGGETPEPKSTPSDDATASQEDKENPEYWKKQYGASSSEAKRLAAENKQLKEYVENAEPVISILRSDPELYAQVQQHASTDTPTGEQNDDWDIDESKKIEEAVKKAVSPLVEEQDRQARERVKRIVDNFKKDKGITEEKWQVMKEYLPAWTAVKNPPSLREALDKTLYMVDADEAAKKAREQGRNEAFAEMTNAKDANVPSGGTPASSSKKPISPKQKDIAEAMGLNPDEVYGE